jgi:hypothetical protein
MERLQARLIEDDESTTTGGLENSEILGTDRGLPMRRFLLDTESMIDDGDRQDAGQDSCAAASDRLSGPVLETEAQPADLEAQNVTQGPALTYELAVEGQPVRKSLDCTAQEPEQMCDAPNQLLPAPSVGITSSSPILDLVQDQSPGIPVASDVFAKAKFVFGESMNEEEKQAMLEKVCIARRWKVSWKAIQEQYFPEATTEACRAHYKGKVTARDTKLVVRARECSMSWEKIQVSYFPNDTAQSCRKRYEQYIPSNLMHMNHLLTDLRRDGLPWEIVQERLGTGSSAAQLRERAENIEANGAGKWLSIMSAMVESGASWDMIASRCYPENDAHACHELYRYLMLRQSSMNSTISNGRSRAVSRDTIRQSMLEDSSPEAIRKQSELLMLSKRAARRTADHEFIKKLRASQSNGLSKQDIHTQHYPDMEFRKFDQRYQRIQRLMNVEDSLEPVQGLDDHVMATINPSDARPDTPVASKSPETGIIEINQEAALTLASTTPNPSNERVYPNADAREEVIEIVRSTSNTETDAEEAELKILGQKIINRQVQHEFNLSKVDQPGYLLGTIANFATQLKAVKTVAREKDPESFADTELKLGRNLAVLAVTLAQNKFKL